MATLTINVTNAGAFSGGYRVRYRKVGSVPYTYVTPTVNGNSLIIPNVEAGVQYEGLLEGVCVNSGVTSYTNTQPFITA